MDFTLHQLVVGYQAHGNQPALRVGPVTTTLPSSRLTCLTGPNGSGKSTLLRTLAGFQPPLGGEVMVNLDGEEHMTSFSSLPIKERALLVSVVLTTPLSSVHLTVNEVVALGRQPHTGYFGRLGSHDHDIVRQSLEQVGIAPLSHRMMTTLSDGERQKVMIAKALAQETPVILMDEPTAFLDYPSKMDIIRLLSRLAHQHDKTILFSTHDLDLALAVADDFWLLDDEGFHPQARTLVERLRQWRGDT